MRKLASVRTISYIRPIPDADAIETLQIEGWEVVSKKGEFAPGDKCVYFEVDSFLPLTDPRFAFLEKSCRANLGDTVGARLRTVRLRGQLSQGLALPLHVFPEIEPTTDVHTDVTDILNVRLYEPPVPTQLSGEIFGAFPSFIRKTDQERIQNMPDVLLDTDSLWEATIKLDGTSCTIYRKDDHIGVCSRNWELKENKENTMWRTLHDSGAIDLIRELKRNIAIQGEIIGPGIQGNNEKLTRTEFLVFDIWDIDEQRYFSVRESSDVIRYSGLRHVPLYMATKLDRFSGDIHNILKLADGYSLNPGARREGLVFKRADGQRSFKVISNEYLLKSH